MKKYNQYNAKKCYCIGNEKVYDGYDKFTKPYKSEKTEFLGKCIKVPEVIGRNSCQVLLECVIPFPTEYPAIAIKDIQKEVKNLNIYVCKNKVLINGILHKNINYKTYEGYEYFNCDCEKLQTVYGDVRHVSVDIPFKCYIDVPGARPGDSYQVEFAGVEDECEVDILEDPALLKECAHESLIPPYKPPYVPYKKLREKVVVKIDLKVLRPIQITVTPDYPNICP